jgi:GT2 family glycosyltransferase
MIPSYSTWVAKAWHATYTKLSDAQEVSWVASHNLIVRKNIFYDINGFREDLAVSEDVDFCQRATQRGYKIISDPKISVTHLKNPETIIEFYQKEFWRGKSAMRLFIKNFPSFKGSKALLYGIFSLFLLFSIVIGLIVMALKGEIFILIFSLCAILVTPLLLATKSCLRQNQIKYFFQLFILYFIYGISRGAASIHLNNFR